MIIKFILSYSIFLNIGFIIYSVWKNDYWCKKYKKSNIEWLEKYEKMNNEWHEECVKLIEKQNEKE